MFLFDGPEDCALTLVLAHGAGAPMDSPAMTSLAHALAGVGLRVARFEFAYMAGRRTGESRKPPPRAENLASEYLAAIEALASDRPLVIGGKSMGGRVASMVADELFGAGKTCGLLCFGYPFHPPAKPGQLRTKHLVDPKTPTLIVQGTRDPFGSHDEVATYELSPAIEWLWLDDGDHDLRPRKAVSGFSVADHLRTMSEAVSTWSQRIVNRSVP
jgi:predicted alpha/beta-hydrolase family hydrolase